MFNYFKCTTSSSKVLGTVTPEQYLQTIQNGDENLERILKARESYQIDPQEYTQIKTQQIPCYTLNFTFDKKRSNATIVDSTGYMYLDLDGTTEINMSNPLVYATWLSLSGTGRGILVKVEGLTPENFKYVYEDVANDLEISADGGAKKATQVNILSYDPDLHIYSDAHIFEVDSKKYHYAYLQQQEKTVESVMGPKFIDLRFDNLPDLIENVEFNGEVIHDFKTKVLYGKAYLPWRGVSIGRRNNVLYGYLSQVRAIQPEISFEQLFHLAKSVNDKFFEPPLAPFKVKEITSGVMKIDRPTIRLNAKRRFVFNADYELTPAEKSREVIKIISTERGEKSRRKIELAIDEWNFEKSGKITQKGLQESTKMNIKTIKKYYSEFKSQIQLLNQEYAKPKK